MLFSLKIFSSTPEKCMKTTLKFNRDSSNNFSVKNPGGRAFFLNYLQYDQCVNKSAHLINLNYKSAPQQSMKERFEE